MITIWPESRKHGRLLRRVVLSLAFLAIVADSVVALTALSQLRQANAQMQRALEASLVVRRIGMLVEDSARDQRTYRLVGDPRSLDRYRNARAELPAALQRLRGLIAEQGSAERLARLSSVIEQDTAALAASLTPVEPSADPASMQSARAASIERTSAIAAAIDDLLGNEERLLGTRSALIAGRNAVTFGTIVLGAVISIALIGVIFALMRRDLRRSELLAATQSGALRESEQRFHRIFDESPLGIVLAEADSQCILQANPAFCRMLGCGAAQIVGRTIAERTHADDREMLTSAIRHDAGQNRDIELRYVARSGTIAWAGVRLARLSASAGRPELLLALTEDVTRAKRVEAELRQAQKMEAIRQLTGGIAHDFNNLLGVIIGNVEFLIDAAGDQEQAELAREILSSALSGADLTRRLLAFARRQALQPRRIDMNAYLPNHIAILRRLLGESITVVTTLAPDLWPTRADPSQVGDALLNLAINARDAMPHGGTITIATENARLEADQEVIAGDYVALSVTDSGMGMAPNVLERAIEPFFTTKTQGTGSGLGLSMIFGFAKQSGGHLRIESQLAQGTTVRLFLPRAQAVDADRTDEAAEPPVPQGTESILLVDDNSEMRTVARRHLVSLGYHVSEAGNGPAALEILRNGTRFDLRGHAGRHDGTPAGYRGPATSAGSKGAVHNRLLSVRAGRRVGRFAW
jgi:PAS domain S-box-containing protein